MEKRSKKDQENIITEALDRFEVAGDSWSEIYEQSIADVQFVDDDDGQWEDSARESRHNRPCLTFDKLSAAVDRVVGGQLANMPSIKVRAAEEGDEDIAEVYQGLIQQIDQRGIQAFKTAFKFAVKSGWGCVLVDHDYIDDVSLDQDIVIREIKNPFAVLIDPVIQVQNVQEWPRQTLKALATVKAGSAKTRFAWLITIVSFWKNKRWCSYQTAGL